MGGWCLVNAWTGGIFCDVYLDEKLDHRNGTSLIELFHSDVNKYQIGSSVAALMWLTRLSDNVMHLYRCFTSLYAVTSNFHLSAVAANQLRAFGSVSYADWPVHLHHRSLSCLLFLADV